MALISNGTTTIASHGRLRRACVSVLTKISDLPRAMTGRDSATLSRHPLFALDCDVGHISLQAYINLDV